MVRYLMAMALVVGMSASATATVINIPLTFVPASDDYNRITVDIDSSIGDDDDEADVLNGSYLQLRLDYTFDTSSRAVTSVNYIDFMGGSFDLEDTHFDLSILADIDGYDVGGTFFTPSPHGSITSSTTTPTEPYVNTTLFPTDEHMVRVNRGRLRIKPPLVSATNYYLDQNPIQGTTDSEGTLTTTLTSVESGVANYDVEFIFPAYFQETVEDIITATITGSGTFKATGSFSIEPSNYPPVANDDSFTCDEDIGCVKYGYEGILINDTDADGDELSAFKMSDPSHGTVFVYESGAIKYMPEEDYFGPDSFTYKAFDGSEWSDEATVNLDVLPVNDAPVAVDDFFTCTEDGTLVLYANESILANDTDVDDDHGDLEAERHSDPSHGSITWWADNGGLKYVPDPGFVGTDTFKYRAFDGEDYSYLATVEITVEAAPIPIPGDTNNDGKVNDVDAAVLAANWGENRAGYEYGDFNGDGKVDMKDASIMAANWGDHTSEAAVPEPGSVLLLATGLLAVVGLRRRV